MTGFGRGFPFAKFDTKQTEEQVRQVIEYFPELSRVPSLLLVLLWDGRLKTYTYLRDEMDRHLGWVSSNRSLTDAAKRCRPHIKEKGLHIKTVPGVGYCLVFETPMEGLSNVDDSTTETSS